MKKLTFSGHLVVSTRSMTHGITSIGCVAIVIKLVNPDI
jgi:hypothetical protein